MPCAIPGGSLKNYIQQLIFECFFILIPCYLRRYYFHVIPHSYSYCALSLALCLITYSHTTTLLIPQYSNFSKIQETIYLVQYEFSYYFCTLFIVKALILTKASFFQSSIKYYIKFSSVSFSHLRSVCCGSCSWFFQHLLYIQITRKNKKV